MIMHKFVKMGGGASSSKLYKGLLALCLAAITFSAVGEDWTAFSKKMDITFSGYSGSSALTDFPALVKLSPAIFGFSYDDFASSSNGADLRFADSAGNMIPHEIDTWDPSGVSTIWVKVPTLTSTTKITAYYGCATPPDALDAKTVWDDNYVGVWHLGESSLPLIESSGKSVNFTEAGGTGVVTYAAQGLIGKAVDFGPSGTKNIINAPDHSNLDGFEKFTIEVWSFMTAHVSGTASGILTKRNDWDKECAFYMYDDGSSTRLLIAHDGKAPSGTVTMAPVVGDWCHQAYTYDGSEAAITAKNNAVGYVNGVSKGTQTVSVGQMYNSSAGLHLGNLHPNDARNFPGKIDEVRISSSARSADWVKASYETVAKAGFSECIVQQSYDERTLVVTVHAGVTNTLDAASVTSSITNIVKLGGGTLIASAIASYEGDFTIAGGVFDVGVLYGAGKSGCSNTIYVLDGASLQFSGGVKDIFKKKHVVLEGAPAPGTPGKFFNTATAQVNVGPNVSITLNTDADIVLANSSYRMVMTADIDLGGHTLTISKVKGSQVELDDTTFCNPGHVVVGPNLTLMQESGTMTFETPESGSPTLTLSSGATLNAKTTISAAGWTLYATNGTTTITANKTQKPTETRYGVWDGNVVFGGTENLANYTGDWGQSNTVFNLKGAVFGAGTMKVGPGWLNLHNETNTFSGSVTVTGQNLTSNNPILPGGGGIGLWNGATCFTNASSVTFNDSARLAFMDNTVCTVGSNVVFAGGEGDVQSISGGVYTATSRSNMAGFTKTGAGTLLVDSPVAVTGLADIQAGTLTVANRFNMYAQDQAGMIAPMPVFSNLKFAAGTKLDLSHNLATYVNDIYGAPTVTNVGTLFVSGKWTLSATNEVLRVYGDNEEFAYMEDIMGDEYQPGMLFAGIIAFPAGSTFDFADKEAFETAVAEAGDYGLVVADVGWVMSPAEGANQLLTVGLPKPATRLGAGWRMVADRVGDRTQLRLVKRDIGLLLIIR